MKYRYLSIFFLMLLLSIGAVCAQDDIASSSGGDVLSVDNNADILENELGSGNIIEINDDNYYNYFSEDGTILKNANISDNDTLILGNINDKVFDIDRPLTITSNGTPINNTEITLNKGSDNSIIENLTIMNEGDVTAILVSEAENITIISNKIFTDSIGNNNAMSAVFANLANNLKIMDNIFEYVGRDNDTHFNSNIVIGIVESDGVLIEKNRIQFDVESNATASNKVILASQSNDIVISHNVIHAAIPSSSVDWYTGNVYSEGIALDDCNEVTFTRNIIAVKSSGYTGEYDTIYGVHATGDNVSIVGNLIGVLDAPYGYGVIISGEEFSLGYNLIYAGIDIIELLNKSVDFTDYNYDDATKSGFYDNLTSSIDIKTIIDDLISNVTTPYACGIEVDGLSTGVIELNMIATTAVSSYGIYTANWAGDVIAEMDMNFILGAGDSVFGMSLSGNEAFVEESAIYLFGNYTTGIASTMGNINITSVAIESLGSNEGTPAGYDMMGIETTGIHIVSGDASITNSHVNTIGKYAVDFKGEGAVTDNNLTAELLSGDFAVDYIQNRGVLVVNNIPAMELDYTLTNDTFYVYFDEQGKIREQIGTDNLTFIGPFSNLVNMIYIDSPIDLLSDDARLIDMTIFIRSENVSVDGFKFTGELSGIYVEYADNVEIRNNFFNIICYDDYDNLVIGIRDSDNVLIKNNTIIFAVENNGTYRNRAIHAQDSDNLTMLINTVIASLPSRPIDWTTGIVYSEGVILDGCDNAVLDGNDISVTSTKNTVTDYDTVYGVHILGDNARILGNNITVSGAPYGYGLVISGENFNIAENDQLKTNMIDVESDTYSCGIEVDGLSNGVIDANNIKVKGDSAYGIYTADWAGDVKINITGNMIMSSGITAFGMSLSGSETLLELNTILMLDGNFTTGIASAVTNITINNNTIVANGSNVGTPVGYETMGIETTGIHIVRGNAIVTNNTVTTSGDFTVDDEGTGKVTDNYLVASKYTGDASVEYDADNVIVENNVPEMKRAVISAEDVVMYYKEGGKYVAVLIGQGKKPMANKTVTLTIVGVSYKRTTDENGTVSLNIRLSSGNYTLSASYVGEGIYTNATCENNVIVLPTVNGNDVVKVFRNGTQYYATFLDNKGNPLADGTEVTFNIAGIMYKRLIDGGEGKARLNINLGPGEYIVTAINPVTGEMHSNNITVISSIVNNTDLIKYYKNGSQYVVTILGDDGNVVGAGEFVTFNINGILYTRVTNESGQAKLNINLEPGSYVVTAEYNGCMVSNNITVLRNDPGYPYAGQHVTFNINGVLYEAVTDENGIAHFIVDLMPGQYIIATSFNGSDIENNMTISS